MGKPIHITQKPNPSVEEVDELHKQYKEGLQEIFEEYKSEFGIGEDQHLEFI